jgi:hypothetical protein
MTGKNGETIKDECLFYAACPGAGIKIESGKKLIP